MAWTYFCAKRQWIHWNCISDLGVKSYRNTQLLKHQCKCWDPNRTLSGSRIRRCTTLQERLASPAFFRLQIVNPCHFLVLPENWGVGSVQPWWPFWNREITSQSWLCSLGRHWEGLVTIKWSHLSLGIVALEKPPMTTNMPLRWHRTCHSRPGKPAAALKWLSKEKFLQLPLLHLWAVSWQQILQLVLRSTAWHQAVGTGKGRLRMALGKVREVIWHQERKHHWRKAVYMSTEVQHEPQATQRL